MFEPSSKPRLFHIAPGIDFAKGLLDGLNSRLVGKPPDAMARVEIFVNTTRMKRRITALFQDAAPCLLPRIRLVTDLANDPNFADIPLPVKPLARRLEIAQLTRQLIAQEDYHSHADSAFDLADSLADLMDEMQGEGVDPSAIAKLDVGDHAHHWQRAQKFIKIVAPFFGDDAAPDNEARQRRVAERLIAQWQDTPPQHPVVIAGSTGSRGTTNMLMQAVAKLPQGAVILPGFDTAMPPEIWDALGTYTQDNLTHEDHPQYRFHSLMHDLDMRHDDVTPWCDRVSVNPARNALVSLALQPAPVTDRWMNAPLEDVAQATQDISLIAAPSPRIEAVTIALRLRQAVADGQTAALITPNRLLTRAVTAALDRWQIEPDDSAGTPLSGSPTGRLLRQITELTYKPLTPERLLSLLKHPLVNGQNRGNHLKHTRDLELQCLRRGMTQPGRANVTDWATKRDVASAVWADWLFDALDRLIDAQPGPVNLHLTRVLETLNHLTSGDGPVMAFLPTNGDTAPIKPDRKEAARVVALLQDAGPSAGTISAPEFGDIFGTILNAGEVRDPISPHPGVMIWGTLEARVQGADLLILAGLNDGIWPETTAPDPWLNRKMRQDAGLPLPERRIGLSAHDFQQAIAAREVWLTRSIRDAEAETVPSRWLNRLSNLMQGRAPDALAAMKARGDHWLEQARALERPAIEVAKTLRPSPAPPKDHRPTQLSVTKIETLIRDPYEIYARHVLKLHKLRPLNLGADAALRGQVIHDIFERFIDATRTDLPHHAQDLLMQIADDTLAETVPQTAIRAIWRAKLVRAVPWFLTSEGERRKTATPMALESTGSAKIHIPDFTLIGRADRIDLTAQGRLVIYDYKTGTVPTPKLQDTFDFQLPLLAHIAQTGGFDGVAATPVDSAAHIGLGSKTIQQASKKVPDDIAKTWEHLTNLIASYANDTKGYTARRAIAQTSYDKDYDHLSRYGEWDETDEAKVQKVGQ